MAFEPPASVFSAACRGDVETLRAILAAKPSEGASIRGYDGCAQWWLGGWDGLGGWGLNLGGGGTLRSPSRPPSTFAPETTTQPHSSTPLLLAAHAGHMEAVELLLQSPGVCTRGHLNRLRRNGTSMLW
jgi:hypothetical protein